MKFDYIVGNPPYMRRLHFKVSIKTFKQLKENGEFIFIQPATAFFNKNKNPTESQREYTDILLNHETEVQIVGGDVFDAGFLSDLSITKIKKTKDSETINKITYKNTETYENVELQNISLTQIPPKIYASIRDKIEKYTLKSGSLKSITSKNGGQGIKISSIRGNVDQDSGLMMSNFYSFYSPPNYKDNYKNHDEGMVVQCKKEQGENIYDYLELKVPQMALALYKYSSQTFNFMYVPLFDFNKTYTNTELYDELDFTQKEQEYINKAIPDYSARTKQKLTLHINK